MTESVAPRPGPPATVHKFRLRSGVPSSPILGAAAVIAFDAVAYFLTFSSISSLIAWGLAALNVLGLILLWRGHWVASHPTLTLEAGNRSSD